MSHIIQDAEDIATIPAGPAGGLAMIGRWFLRMADALERRP